MASLRSLLIPGIFAWLILPGMACQQPVIRKNVSESAAIAAIVAAHHLHSSNRMMEEYTADGKLRFSRLLYTNYYNAAGYDSMQVHFNYIAETALQPGQANDTAILTRPVRPADTTYFWYNAAGFLVKSQARIQMPQQTLTEITIQTYDTSNNQLSQCTIRPGNSDTLCTYHLYQYDRYGRIIAMRDSLSGARAEAGINSTPEMVCTYDERGNVVTVGNFRKVYNNKNQLISYDLGAAGRIDYLYDAAGHLIQETSLTPAAANTAARDTNYVYQHQYDQRNLETAMRSLPKNRLFRIFRYTYQ